MGCYVVRVESGIGSTEHHQLAARPVKRRQFDHTIPLGHLSRNAKSTSSKRSSHKAIRQSEGINAATVVVVRSATSTFKPANRLTAYLQPKISWNGFPRVYQVK